MSQEMIYCRAMDALQYLKRAERGHPTMKHAISALILAAASLTASAAELVIHTASFHTDRHPTTKASGGAYNEQNPGLGFRQDFGAAALQVGTYRNSIRRQSAYAITDMAAWRAGGFTVGPFAGLVTGYTNGTGPAAGAFARFEGDTLAATVRLAPVQHGESAVFSLELGAKF